MEEKSNQEKRKIRIKRYIIMGILVVVILILLYAILRFNLNECVPNGFTSLELSSLNKSISDVKEFCKTTDWEECRMKTYYLSSTDAADSDKYIMRNVCIWEGQEGVVYPPAG